MSETTRLPIPRPVAADLLQQIVFGRNLRGHTLGDQLGAGPTLLVFLRHFG